jgi:hypothetical protein
MSYILLACVSCHSTLCSISALIKALLNKKAVFPFTKWPERQACCSHELSRLFLCLAERNTCWFMTSRKRSLVSAARVAAVKEMWWRWAVLTSFMIYFPCPSIVYFPTPRNIRCWCDVIKHQKKLFFLPKRTDFTLRHTFLVLLSTGSQSSIQVLVGV